MFDSLGIYDATTSSHIFGNYTGGVVLTLPNENPWAINELSNDTIDLMSHPDIYTDDNLTLSVIQYNESIYDLAKDQTQNMTKVVHSNTTLQTTGEPVKAYRVDSIELSNDTETMGETRIYAKYENPPSAKYDNTVYIFKYINPYVNPYSEFISPLDDNPTAKKVIDSAKIVEFAESDNFSRYENNNTDLSIRMSFPSNWSITDNDLTITAGPSKTAEDDPYLDNNLTYITVSPGNINGLEDFVARAIEINKEQVEDYQIIESSQAKLGDQKAHRIVYRFNFYGEPSQGLTYYTIVGNQNYQFDYIARVDKYPVYLPIVNRIIKNISFNEEQNPDARTRPSLSGFELDGPPIDLVINQKTNKLYIAPQDANSLYVVNATSNTLLSNITIGGRPSSLAMNPLTNTIYAISTVTDKMYAIDGTNDTIVDEVQLGPNVFDIAVDYNEIKPAGLIFVTNQGVYSHNNHNISVIDGETLKLVGNIALAGTIPYGIGLDPLTNRAYVTGTSTSSTPPGVVSVIDYLIDSNRTFLIENMKSVFNYTGLFPYGVAVDPKTSEVYVANSGGHTVTVFVFISSEIF
jgi:YVTN family beta-propeller protein